MQNTVLEDDGGRGEWARTDGGKQLSTEVHHHFHKAYESEPFIEGQ